MAQATQNRAVLHHSAGVVHTEPQRLRQLVLAARTGALGAGNCWLLGDPTGTLTGGPTRSPRIWPAIR